MRTYSDYTPASRKAFWATSAVALAGLAWIVSLLLVPSSIQGQSLVWPVVDKRWMLASYGLAVALVFAPSAFHRLFADGLRTPRSLVGATVASGAAASRRQLPIALLIGLVCATAQGGTIVPGLMERPIEPHEEVHLGPLAAIDQGRTPYSQARTQYGPGHQIATYGLMRIGDFSIGGFRAAFAVMNMAAHWAIFSLLVFTLGTWIGAAAILAYLYVTPSYMLMFSGWFIVARWVDPIVVGALLPWILWTGSNTRRRMSVSTAVLGVVSGALAWMSQENFSTGLITAALVLASTFALRRVSLLEGTVLLAAFAAAHVGSFVILLAALVGIDDLRTALSYAFELGGLWARGLANTPWTSEYRLANTPWTSDYSTWTVAFYATPVVVPALAWLALHVDVEADTAERRRRRGIFLGYAAAAASLVPITLLRSDEPHFVGPARALPALLVLAIVMLPGLLCRRPARREVVRLALLAIVLAIYVVPHGRPALAIPLRAQLAFLPHGLKELGDVFLTHDGSADRSLFDRRLGLDVDDDAVCCNAWPEPYASLRDRIERIRAFVGDRPTFFLPDVPKVSSAYFLGNIQVSNSEPETGMTQWLVSDIATLREELVANPPGCVVARDETFGTPAFEGSLARYGIDATAYPAVDRIAGLVAVCKPE